MTPGSDRLVLYRPVIYSFSPNSPCRLPWIIVLSFPLPCPPLPVFPFLLSVII
ncbi:hypothetical protein P170DRAFT_209230 [Aspergillus steynii IBT 23096]|uniref:Uncharacterized protein n=1 Tax=Aspergillus steynii IBT 23096 TaxID=1392250 RepID=A0A2I2G5W1_9EURO|nr:uncharacterized protein P170DRAFT_209230 [Aspergillus steynii IBT 23096]PLB48260.1 hypothetical protein P170DRAFT_209230 [Aspergillus steynii IBT 23096]